MTNKEKLLLIDEIINKAYEVPAGDPTSWAGFMEGTLSAIGMVINFKEGEHESDTSV